MRDDSRGVRRDLLAHLNVITCACRRCASTREDVPDLLRHYVDRLVDERGPAVPPLQRRGAEPPAQLSVAGQRARAQEPGAAPADQGGAEEIRLEEIERELAAHTPTDEPLVKQDLLALPLREAREQFERAYLQQQLLLCNGKVGQLAKRVGMERTHLYRKLRSLGVDFRQLTED